MAVSSSTGFRAALLGAQPFVDIFHNGCIEVYSGPQPENADSAATGTLLARVTRDGATWTPGAPAGGLQYTQNVQFVTNNPAHVWTLVGLDEGVAGWFRVLPNAADPGNASATRPRIDGAIGLLDSTDDVQMFLPTLDLNPATSIAIPSWWYAIAPL